MKIMDYLYFRKACLNVDNLILFLVSSCFIATLVFVFLALLVIKIAKIHCENKKRIIAKCIATNFFSVLAFGTNMIINFPVFLDYLGNPNKIQANSTYVYVKYPVGLIDLAKYIKISNYEFFRGIFEIISFIPIGICIYLCFKKYKILKAMIYTLLCSISFELFGNMGHISLFYWPTLINNLLGSLIGCLALYTFKTVKTSDKTKRKLIILAQIPLILSVIIYVGIYLVYHTNIFFDIYPDYYKKIDADRLNVRLSKNVVLEDDLDNICLNQAVSDEQLEKLVVRLFEVNDSEIDVNKCKYFSDEQSKRVWNLYNNNDETMGSYLDSRQNILYFYNNSSNIKNEDENLDKVIDNFCDELNISMSSNKCVVKEDRSLYITDCLVEVADGVYCRCELTAKFDRNNYLYEFEMANYLYWGVEFKKEKGLNTGIISKNYGKQGKDSIVSPKEAYQKLYNGEGYAKGLASIKDNGKIDINVSAYRCILDINSIGCYEYVYVFYIEPIYTEDGTLIDRIYVPAMKSYY